MQSGPESIANICRLQPAQINLKVILITVTWRHLTSQGPPFEDASKVHRHWDLAMKSLKVVAAICKMFDKCMAIYDNPMTICEMFMLVRHVFMTKLWPVFVEFSNGFSAFAAFQDCCTKFTILQQVPKQPTSTVTGAEVICKPNFQASKTSKNKIKTLISRLQSLI